PTISGGTLTIATLSQTTGLNLSGGTLSIGGTLVAVNATISGGTLTGVGTLLIPDTATLTWTGGSMNGGGATQVQPGGTLLLSGAVDRILDKHILDNFGTIRWTDGTSATGRLVMSATIPSLPPGTLINEAPTNGVGGLLDIRA